MLIINKKKEKWSNDLIDLVRLDGGKRVGIIIMEAALLDIGRGI